MNFLFEITSIIRDNKDICMCILILIIVTVFVSHSYCTYEKTDICENKWNSMDLHKDIENVRKLKALLEFVNTIEIDPFSKNKIVNCIQFELDLMKRGVVMNLGEAEYKKITGEK